MRGFKRFAKRAGVALLVLVGVLALLIFGTRAHFQRQGERELGEVTAKLDADDPGWRMESILERRNGQSIAADQDAAPIVFRVIEQGRPEWEKYRYLIDASERDTRVNYTPRFELLVWIAGGRSATEGARTTAREQLLTRPAGRYPLQMKDNPFSTLLPHLEKVRSVANLLDYDAALASLDGDPTRGLRSARSCINVSRSIGDEPCLISQLVRMACGNVASRSAMRVLAWGELAGPSADAELSALQAAFAAEAETPWFEYGVRGERAMIHQFFDGLETGRIQSEELTSLMGNGSPAFLRSRAFTLYRGFLPGDHAESLRIMTRYLEICKLPYHERRAAMQSVKFPPKPPESLGYILTNLILPATDKVATAGLRCRGELLSASVAVACERYRLKHGHWPESLEAIPKEILPAIPTDPFDGEPIRYRPMPDGIAVFSIDPDGLKPPENFNQQQSGPFNGLGVGWRMYDPERRGLPPEYVRPVPGFEESVMP